MSLGSHLRCSGFCHGRGEFRPKAFSRTRGTRRSRIAPGPRAAGTGCCALGRGGGESDRLEPGVVPLRAGALAVLDLSEDKRLVEVRDLRKMRSMIPVMTCARLRRTGGPPTGPA